MRWTSNNLFLDERMRESGGAWFVQFPVRFRIPVIETLHPCWYLSLPLIHLSAWKHGEFTSDERTSETFNRVIGVQHSHTSIEGKTPSKVHQLDHIYVCIYTVHLFRIISAPPLHCISWGKCHCRFCANTNSWIMTWKSTFFFSHGSHDICTTQKTSIDIHFQLFIIPSGHTCNRISIPYP